MATERGKGGQGAGGKTIKDATFRRFERVLTPCNYMH